MLGRVSRLPPRLELPPARLQAGGAALCVLAPCADLANHAQQPNALFWFSPAMAAFQLVACEVGPAHSLRHCTHLQGPLALLPASWPFTGAACPAPPARPGPMPLQAAQYIAPGEEVRIRYSPAAARCSNADLLCCYGFALPGNVADRIPLQAAAPGGRSA